MKLLDVSPPLVADTPINYLFINLVYTLLQHFWDTEYKNNFDIFPFIKKSFNKPYLKWTSTKIR